MLVSAPCWKGVANAPLSSSLLFAARFGGGESGSLGVGVPRAIDVGEVHKCELRPRRAFLAFGPLEQRVHRGHVEHVRRGVGHVTRCGARDPSGSRPRAAHAGRPAPSNSPRKRPHRYSLPRIVAVSIRPLYARSSLVTIVSVSQNSGVLHVLLRRVAADDLVRHDAVLLRRNAGRHRRVIRQRLRRNNRSRPASTRCRSVLQSLELRRLCAPICGGEKAVHDQHEDPQRRLAFRRAQRPRFSFAGTAVRRHRAERRGSCFLAGAQR